LIFDSARILYVSVAATAALSTSLLVLRFVGGLGAERIWAYVAAIPPVTLATSAANRLGKFAERAAYCVETSQRRPTAADAAAPGIGGASTAPAACPNF
jgi:hypothetical protein